MKINVGILEDNQQVRETFVSLFNHHDDTECVAEFESAVDAKEIVALKNLNVMLVDIHLPDGNGIEFIRFAKPKMPNTQFVIFSVFEDDENIFNALEVGATGYLIKNTSAEKMIEAIKEVFAGGSPMSSNIARKVVSVFQKKSADSKSIEILTAREHEILIHLSKGFRYKEIAAKLGVSVETIRTHIRNIYEKLQVDSRTDALNKVFGK